MSTATPLITVERFMFKLDWTISRFMISGRLTGFSIEDEVRRLKRHGETAIPEGDYPLSTRFSPKFSKEFYWNDRKKELIGAKDYKRKTPDERKNYVPHELIWITNVPNFSLILWHWGNTDDDTEGCIISGKILGEIKGQEAVLQSRAHYLEWYPRVFPMIQNGGQFIRITTAAGSIQQRDAILQQTR